MRQDFFEFTPQFTLIIAGNHKPGLRNVDEAIRRRLHLVPFTVTIPKHERDDRLGEKLKEEWPGILAWMIEGSIEWGGEGLQPPEAVRTATEAYFQSEDAIAAWIEERCTTVANDFASYAALFKSWADYATKAGEEAGSTTELNQTLEGKGFERKRTAGARGFIGIAVKSTESSQWYDQ